MKIIKDACALLVITLVAGLLLGIVYDITKAPIAQQVVLTEQKSCKEVFHTASSFETIHDNKLLNNMQKRITKAGYVTTLNKVLEAHDNKGHKIGHVFSVTDSEGYGGDIDFMVGISNDGTVNGIAILSINETAGLGMNATKDSFKNQFNKKKVDSFKYTKTGSKNENEIDAISGATKTTNTIVNGTNAALEAHRFIEKGKVK